jgi:hypothetical protein
MSVWAVEGMQKLKDTQYLGWVFCGKQHYEEILITLAKFF